MKDQVFNGIPVLRDCVLCKYHPINTANTGGTQPTDVQQLNVVIALLNDMVKVWDAHGVIHKDSWYYERASAVIAQRATV